MNQTLLVNEDHPLPEDYLPEDLISLYSLKDRSFFMPPVSLLLNREAAFALNELCRATKQEGGFDSIVEHAYRNREEQEALYRRDVSGCTAKPGCSEHETGLSVDLFCADPDRQKEYHHYLTENCHRFGYIYRYPRGWEHITRIPESPDHFRYVGKEAAEIIHQNELVLEEFLDSSLTPHDRYSIPYIFMSIFGPKMKGHWQTWPEIDLDELKAVNPDTVGWIHMEGTPIDYPVMYRRECPDYYLTHNFSDEASAHGSIIMHNPSLRGILMLSGHHMQDCSMFMKLIEIDDRMSLEVHPELFLFLKGTMYRARWFAADRLQSARDMLLPENESAAARDAWLRRLKEGCLLSNDLNPEPEDEILICSTCARNLDGMFVLYGVMKKTSG